MRIAQVAPLYEAVPPRLYGGTERVVHYLTEELVRQGQQVTLFASGDSRTSAELVAVVPRALRLHPDCQDSLAHHFVLMNRVVQRAHEFDILHFHIDYLPFPLLRRLGRPSVTTLHGRLDIPDLEAVYRDFRDIPVVSISDAQRAPLPFVNWQATVHHGAPRDLYRFSERPGDYVAFLGRISPEKRVDRAIEIAVRAGIEIRIAAKVDKADKAYFEERVRPLLDHPLVRYLGEIGEHEKNELLGGARALLFPIDWPEPFGLAMIEALACGTPTIAFRCGSVPEVVRDGETGFIVEDVDAALAALARIDTISRERCRAVFEESFCAGRMVRDYLRVYENLLGGRPAPRVETGAVETLRVEDHWYVLAESARADERNRVLKYGDTFGLFNRYGDIRHLGMHDQGLYHEGTRFLSEYQLRVNGQRPMLLNSSVKRDNSRLTVDLTTADLVKDGELAIPEGALHIFRGKFIYKGVHYERLVFSNYGDRDIELTVDIDYACDYIDIFEVRGTRRVRRGEPLPAKPGEAGVELGYRGLDNVVRRTAIAFSRRPIVVDSTGARFRLALAPQTQDEIQVSVACRVEPAQPVVLAYHDASERLGREAHEYFQRAATVSTSNEQFNDWIERSAADLQMLVTDTLHGPYPYAGVPWFSTAFGRDGIITAMQTLWYDPALARGVLAYLAAHQADRSDPERDAEPGKILHETRRGELAALNEIPFGMYYGTVDATPLFVMLAGEYWQRTADHAFIESIWGNIKRALEWIDRFGDADGDGFVEYARHGRNGLVQQGWKDSDDSVFHADGSDARPPIAMCEVQGYVYQAKRDAAALARLFGEDAEARRLEREAQALKEQFDRAFWIEELGTYALALDGDKRPCAVRASNAAHALFTGIADPLRAERVAQTLLSRESFNGWGIRTLDVREKRYNPMSYHNGSVWPHDTAIAALGLARYGLKASAVRVLNGLFEASMYMDLHRLPELLCGFEAREGQAPTLYPVACSPQAWASGAVFQLLQAVLGLTFCTGKPQVRFIKPMLPEALDHMEIRNLAVPGGVVDLSLRRHRLDVGVNVLRKEGDIEVAVVV